MNETDLRQLSAPPRSGAAVSLQNLLAESGMRPLEAPAMAKFEIYLDLILRWNARTNLTSVRDVDSILRRHFAESIAGAEALPSDIGTLLDFGSGAGFPGIPIAICCPAIAVTLAESQGKKAAFLRQVVSVLQLNAVVFQGRAETLNRDFDCVTMRAVDRMGESASQAASLVREGGLLALMTSATEFPTLQEKLFQFQWQPPIPLPHSNQRIIVLGTKSRQG
jgi:16S rRNA (guanine527-N7)-methyltransferase